MFSFACLIASLCLYSVRVYVTSHKRSQSYITTHFRFEFLLNITPGVSSTHKVHPSSVIETFISTTTTFVHLQTHRNTDTHTCLCCVTHKLLFITPLHTCSLSPPVLPSHYISYFTLHFTGKLAFYYLCKRFYFLIITVFYHSLFVLTRACVVCMSKS